MELIESLRKFGLNEYESKVYYAASKASPSSASNISKSSGVPRARVYDVLRSLEVKGFVAKKALKPVEYRALPLGSILNGIEKSKRETLEREIRELSRIKKIVEKGLSKEQAEGHDTGAILISGRPKIHNFMLDIVRKSKSVTVTGNRQSLARKKSLIESLRNGKKISVNFSLNPQLRAVVLDSEKSLLFLTPPSSCPEAERALFIDSRPLSTYLSSALKR